MNRWTKLSLTLNALLLGFLIGLAFAGPRPEQRVDLSRCPAHRVRRAEQTPAGPQPSGEPLPDTLSVPVVVPEVIGYRQ